MLPCSGLNVASLTTASGRPDFVVSRAVLLSVIVSYDDARNTVVGNVKVCWLEHSRSNMGRLDLL